MATKPLELQSLKWPFVGLAMLLALTTAWSVYDEEVDRRPWKKYQRDFFKLEESHLKADRERAQKRLEAPETKKRLEALRAELKAASDAISGNPDQRKAYDAAVKADDDAAIKEAEAKLYLGFDKSKQDADYYLLREARHEGNAKEEAELQKKFDAWQKKMDEKTRIYNEAIARHRKTTAERLAFVKRRDDAQAKLDAIEKPIQEIDKRLEAFSGIGKLPAMDPAQATECRRAAQWQKWVEMAEAFCGPNTRWLVKTRTVLKDASGAVLVETRPEWKGMAENPA